MRDLTAAEVTAVTLLGIAYKAFVELPVVHPNDLAEYITALHHCQMIIQARPVVEQS